MSRHLKQTEKHRFQRLHFNGSRYVPLLLPLTALILELLLRIYSGQTLWTGGLFGGLLAAFSLCFLCEAIFSLCRTTVRFWLRFVVTELVTVWFLITFFVEDSFTSFMELGFVLDTAGAAVKDFGGNVGSVIIKGIPVILVFHIPSVACLLIHRFFSTDRQPDRYRESNYENSCKNHTNNRAYNYEDSHPASSYGNCHEFSPKGRFGTLFSWFILAALLFFLAGHYACTCTSTLRTRYYNTSYDSSVRNFGLIDAQIQKWERGIFGSGESAGGFTVQAAVPEENTAAVQDTGSASTADTAQTATPEITNSEKAVSSSDGVQAVQEENVSAGVEINLTAEQTENGSYAGIEAAEPSAKEYLPNVMDLDFDACIAAKGSLVAGLCEYIQSREPTMQNKYTGMFRGKNLILITAEAFSKEIIDPERTPTLYRMANNGIVFEDFYQPSWGGSTSTGEYAWLTGIMPATASAMIESQDSNLYFTMGNQLQRLGLFQRRLS